MKRRGFIICLLILSQLYFSTLITNQEYETKGKIPNMIHKENINRESNDIINEQRDSTDQIQFNSIQPHKDYINSYIDTIVASRNLSGYTNISAQNIVGQTAFNSFATAYSTAGTGTQNDPYILENLNINATLTDMIFQDVLSSMFVFKNSVIFNGGLQFSNSKVMNVSGNLVYNVTNSRAFYIHATSNVNVTDNIFISNSTVGCVEFSQSTNLRFSNNLVIQARDAAKTIFGSTSLPSSLLKMEGNTIHTLGYGMTGDFGTDTLISHNILNSSLSRYFYYGYGFRFLGNGNFTDNFALHQGTEDTYRFGTNYINGKNANGFKVRIENNTFSGFKTDLQVGFHKDILITNNHIKDSHNGLVVLNNIATTIINNNTIDDTDLGVHFMSSGSVTLDGNNLLNMSMGMFFENSNQNIINNTILTNIDYDFYETTSTGNSFLNTVRNNVGNLGTVINNDQEMISYVNTNSLLGNGSKANPFVISGLVLGGIGLTISTNFSIIIEDIVFNPMPVEKTYPLTIHQVGDLTIRNLTLQDSDRGFDLSGLSNVTLEDVTFDRIQARPIRISSSNNVLIQNVTIRDTKQFESISINLSTNITINEVQVENGESTGIFASGGSDFITISNSTISGMQTGISLGFVDNLSIINNVLNGNQQPLDLTSCNDGWIINNNVTGWTSYSDFSDSYNLNFTGNIFRDSNTEVFYIEFGELLFYNNFFINITAPEFSNDDTVNATLNGVGNYWSNLPANASYYLPDLTVNDTAPLRPHPLENKTIDLEFGDSELIFNSSYIYPTLMNITNVFYQDQLIGNITWSDNRIISNNIDVSIFPSLGSYEVLMMSFDVWGVHSMNESVMINLIDNTPPVISAPEDLEFEVGSTGYNITWNISDLTLTDYSIYVDDALNKTGTPIQLDATNTSINIVVDDFSEGTHNITLVVFDLGGNFVSDTVFVIVNPVSGGTSSPTSPGTSSSPTTPTTTTTPTMGATSPSEQTNNDIGLPWWLVLILIIIAILIGYITWFNSKEERREYLQERINELKEKMFNRGTD